MHQFQKTIVRVIALFVICAIIECHARPLTSEETQERASLASRLLERQHDRTSARKRHAEIRLNSEIAKVTEDLKRVKLINGILNQLDMNRLNNMDRLKGPGQNEIINEDLQLTGLKVKEIQNIQVRPSFSPHHHSHKYYHNSANSNVQMRIIPNNVPQQKPVNALQYKKYTENTLNALALATTCMDMREKMKRLNIRIKITCSTSLYQG